MNRRFALAITRAAARPRRPGASTAIALSALLITLLACNDLAAVPTPDPEPLGPIAGTVTDASGQPRASVEITVFDRLHRPGHGGDGPIAQALTDADGTFDIHEVPAGHYNVFAKRDDVGVMIEQVVSDAESMATPASGRALLRLQPLGTLRGEVTDEGGHAVVGATVYLIGSPYSAVTDGEGGYTLPAVAAGEYAVGAWADDFHDAEHVVVTSQPGGIVDVATLVLTAIDDEAFDPGAEVGEWVDVETYLDYRVYGATEWTSATGFARLQPLGMNRAIHTVELRSLTPGTEYEFRLPYDPAVAYPVVLADPTTNMTIHWQTSGALHEFQPRPDTDEWSFRFRTFPDSLSAEPVRIAFGGDIKQSDQPYETYELVWSAYTAQDLHALVITGDWVYDDNDPFKEPYWGDNRFADLWDVYKLHGTDTEGRLTPIVPGIGNHEVGDGGYRGQQYDWDTRTLGDNTVFAVQFPTAPKGWFFAIDIGEYASIVMLDSEHVNPAIGFSQDVQTPWLAQALADRADVPTVFATYHVGAYPAARTFDGGLPRRIRTSWHPLFDASENIRLVFEMHDHVYGESHWIRDGEVVAAGEGIKYLGAGHMGTFQNRAFWNPATTWYLEDAYGLRVKQAESGEEHPDDGLTLDTEGTRTRHVWIVELREDERRVRSYMIDGSERTSFTF